MSSFANRLSVNSEVQISTGDALLEGNLRIPQNARAMVIFVHGSGSGRHSARNKFVAKSLNDFGLGTLLFDLMTGEEELIDMRGGTLRFDIAFLTKRVLAATEWLQNEENTKDLSMGYFGASTGAAAALCAAGEQPGVISAVVSRGGRPDLAGKNNLKRVSCPTLFLVGSRDEAVIGFNQDAIKHMSVQKELRIIPGAGHLFEEPGRLEIVSEFACRWFGLHLRK
jgi:dienelactone hydrolase